MPVKEEDALPASVKQFKANKIAVATLRDITCKAVCTIKHGLRQPGAQSDGKPFIPANWETVFKPQLGSYMKFLISRPDQFRVVEGAGPGLYTVENITGDFTVQAPTWDTLKGTKGKGKGKAGKGKGEEPQPMDGSRNWFNLKGAAKAQGKFGKDAKGKGKGKGFKGFFSKGSNKITAAGKRLAEEQAIEEIKKKLQKYGSSPQTGRAMMPTDWISRFFPAVGPFKEFVMTHPEHFALYEGLKGTYTIGIAEKPAEQEWKEEEPEEDAPEAAREPPTRAAKLLAAAAKEELADEAAAGGGDDWDEDWGDEEAEGVSNGVGDHETYPLEPEPEEEGQAEDPVDFPAQKAASHGSLIRSMLGSSGGSKAKKARLA